MTAREVLSAAKAVVFRGHYSPPAGGKVMLAVNEQHERVKPTSPYAVRWMSVGAICKVAPARSAHDPRVYADHTEAGWQAYLHLQEAAEQQGYAGPVEVDCAGLTAALMMFDKAMQLTPTADRQPARAGRGTT